MYSATCRGHFCCCTSGTKPCVGPWEAVVYNSGKNSALMGSWSLEHAEKKIKSELYNMLESGTI